MQEATTYSVSFLIAVLPLLIVIYFLLFTRPRKRLEIHQDLRKLRTGNIIGAPPTGESDDPASRDGSSIPTSSNKGQVRELDVDELFDEYWSAAVLFVPTLILTIFYLTGFLLCDSYLFDLFDQNCAHIFFSAGFLKAAHPELFAFTGVYLFNLGNIVRRQYLADLNEHVFWSAINRLLLSMGLAIVFVNQHIVSGPGEAGFFFVIGFMANLILDWLVDRALRILNYSPKRRDDIQLQMVRGINLWKEYRLEEEGIESVQNLATANLVELAVHTHYDVRMLIDWIDQAIVLSRFTFDQVETMGKQSMAISAIELAAASPRFNGGNSAISDALAQQLGIDKTLMSNSLDMLLDDQYVRQLWREWQSGRGSMPPTD